MTGRMPFGRYKGRPLSSVPDSYLDWLTTLALREPLASAVEREVSTRHVNAHAPHANTALDPDIARQIVQAGYRALAQQHHPDHGGDTRTMQRINGTAEVLRQLLTTGVAGRRR